MANFINKIDFEKMKETGKRLSGIFNEFTFSFFINKSTKEIDNYIAKRLEDEKLESQSYGYHGFSGYSCLSINEQLVHGIPKDDVFVKETDLLKVDICTKYNEHCADMARMYAFFENNSLYKRMLDCAERSLNVGISNAFSLNKIGTLSFCIEHEILKDNFSVVKDFCGHGIGHNMHEDPFVPNHGKHGKGQTIYSGMAFAIEPMFCQYKNELIIDKNDKWTVSTKDKGISAHIEDTVLITDNGPFVTTK